MPAKCILVYINLRFLISLQKSFQPSAMVIMAVRQNHCIHFFQTNAHAPRIFPIFLRCSHIEQHSVSGCLNIKTKSMFSLQTIPYTGIFHKISDIHMYPLSSGGGSLLFGKKRRRKIALCRVGQHRHHCFSPPQLFSQTQSCGHIGAAGDPT